MKKFSAAIVIMFVLLGTAYGETLNVKIDGALGKLSAVIQKPELESGRKCPMVIIFHGFTGNKNEKLLTTTADLLAANGIASIRFDFNGHGESEGDFVNMTVLNEIEDAKKVLAYVKALDYVESVSIGGHSQGGVVASMLAGELGRENVKSVVLFAPAAVLRDDAIRGNVMGVTYDAGNPPESVKIFGRYDLGRNYMLTSQTLPIYETAEKFTGPVCLIHGTADRIVPYTYSERYHKNYANSEIHLIDGADHGFTGFEDEAARLAVTFYLNNAGNE